MIFVYDHRFEYYGIQTDISVHVYVIAKVGLKISTWTMEFVHRIAMSPSHPPITIGSNQIVLLGLWYFLEVTRSKIYRCDSGW